MKPCRRGLLETLCSAVPSNFEVNAKIGADEIAVRKEHGLFNAQTISDTVVRVEAVQRAIYVLKDFYDFVALRLSS